ncbi:MAG: HAD family hydrolase [Bacteroidales bacterium]|nr:HAD family hydrolase [Bacteroidales bacterium]
MVQAVIFDLDGTLLDTIEDLGEAVNHALSMHGYSLHSMEEYRGMVGHGVRNLVTQALPGELQADESLIDTCLAQFKEYYTSHIDVHTRPYPGMVEVVQQLHARGVKLAIASNKFQSGTETLIAEFFPGIPFVAVLGNRPGYPLKPDPEIVGEVLRKASASPSDAVMVGDSLTDMKTAANGGIRAIAVSWGYRVLEPSPAYSLVHSPSELLSLIL